MSSLRVTSLKGRTGNQSPTLPDGAVVTGVTTSTSFDGDLTGNATTATTATTATNAQGLTGTPDITVNNVSAGIITATTYVGVPEGTNVLKAMLFV